MNSGPIIETRGLRKTYQVGKVDVPALRGVDLTVKPGEFWPSWDPWARGSPRCFTLLAA